MSLVWGRTWLGVKLKGIVMDSQGQECLLRVDVSWDWIPLCVSLGKLLNLSGFQFPHL